MFDIIGDIHGQAEKLKHLLVRLGYKQTTQGFAHPEYKVIFVGDLIDRGLYQVETLSLVKEMVDNQNAYTVMGNHEFNAIGWATPDVYHSDVFLRTHQPNHYKQHKIFLEQVGEHSQQYNEWINWFKSLPLFLDFGQLRVIHACWDNKVIQNIKPYLNTHYCLDEQYIQQAFTPSHELFDYCEILLKGKEITLPAGVYYFDKEGTKRHKSRIKWWLEHANTLNELCILPDDEKIAALEQPADLELNAYQDPIPVIFGHYWLTGKPSIQTPYVACVDYSAALKDGKLVAYRWQGEKILSNNHFIY